MITLLLNFLRGLVADLVMKFFHEARKPDTAEDGRAPGELEDELNDQLDDEIGDRG